MIDRLAARFNAAFGSPLGVVVLFCLTSAWPVAVLFFPGWDPHLFRYLAALTWFSAWTQGPLLLGSRIAAMEAQASARSQEQLLRNQADTMRAVLAIARRLEDTVEDIAEAHGAEVDSDG